MALSLVCELSGHTERVWDATWSPHGTLLATAGADRTVRLWALRQTTSDDDGDDDGTTTSSSTNASGGVSLASVAVIDGLHERTVRRVDWSPCGNMLATASFDGTVSVLDRRETGTFECVATLEGHENEVKAARFSPSGTLLATCGRDKSVWVWELEGGDDHDFECLSVLSDHTQDVKAVAWHPTEDILASASYDNTIKLFSEDADAEWACTDTLKGHENTVWSLCFDGSGTRIASASADRTVKVWKKQSGGGGWLCVSTIAGCHTRDVFDVSWSPLNDCIATACGDNVLRVFEQDREAASSSADAQSFKLVCQLQNAHLQDINAVAWSPADPSLLVSASDDRKVKVWRYTNPDSA
eukprot:m.387291 g.387291  ORF g.387291 m.387291 type:complete len:356 (-) comp20064_c0_seq3:407-1474(-)